MCEGSFWGIFLANAMVRSSNDTNFAYIEWIEKVTLAFDDHHVTLADDDHNVTLSSDDRDITLADDD